MRADAMERRAMNVMQCREMFRAMDGSFATGVTARKPPQKAAPAGGPERSGELRPG